jgi:hypothetical protein
MEVVSRSIERMKEAPVRLCLEELLPRLVDGVLVIGATGSVTYAALAMGTLF